MEISKYRLQKQNTSYEINFNRKILSPYLNTNSVRRLSRPESRTSRGKCATRAEITYCELTYASDSSGLKRSLSVGNVLSRPQMEGAFNNKQRQSLLPIPIKNDVAENNK